jgi:hypothetical protein
MNQHGSVSRANPYGLNDRRSISGKTKEFSLSLQHAQTGFQNRRGAAGSIAEK